MVVVVHTLQYTCVHAQALETFSSTTFQRVLIAVELANSTSLTRRAIVKAEYRVVAANSLRSNYVYAVVMSLAMHYASPTPLTPAEKEGRTATHQWVSRVLGEHLNLRPIQARLSFGIDKKTTETTTTTTAAATASSSNTRTKKKR